MIKKDIFSLLFIKICLIYVKVSHVQLLQPHGLYTVHGILQTRILEWVAVTF